MKSLGSVRVSERTIQNIQTALRKYNEKNVLQMTEAEFRRLAYELLSQLILQNKEIPLKIISD